MQWKGNVPIVDVTYNLKLESMCKKKKKNLLIRCYFYHIGCIQMKFDLLYNVFLKSPKKCTKDQKKEMIDCRDLLHNLSLLSHLLLSRRQNT